MTDQYELADKLKKQFRGRGAAVAGMQATSTSELLKRAESGKDPNENVAEEAFRENYTAQHPGTNPNPNPGAKSGASRPAQGRPDVKKTTAQSRPNPNRSAGRGDSVNDRVNEEIAHQNHVPYQGKKPGNTSSRTNAKKTKKNAQPKVKGGHKSKRKNEPIQPDTEITVKRGNFPIAFLALCLIGLVIVFSIVQSFAKVYQTSSRISHMESDLEALKEEAAGLELKLDEKNDIRTIRDIAVGDLGMAEEDSLQRRFVSISDGERIEVLDAGEDSTGTGGVLFSAWAAFLERFR